MQAMLLLDVDAHPIPVHASSSSWPMQAPWARGMLLLDRMMHLWMRYSMMHLWMRSSMMHLWMRSSTSCWCPVMQALLNKVQPNFKPGTSLRCIHFAKAAA